MDSLTLITRHRQWRAWQFGRRHSGRGADYDSSDDGGNSPWIIIFSLAYLAALVFCIHYWKAAAEVLLYAPFVVLFVLWVIRKLFSV